MDLAVREHIRDWGEPQEDWNDDKRHIYHRVINQQHIELSYDSADGQVEVFNHDFSGGCDWGRMSVWIDLEEL